MHHAIWRNDIDAVRNLLSLGADPSLATPDGLTPLMRAVDVGDCGIVKALLDTQRAECNAIDAAGYTALHDAAKRGNADIIDLLLSAGSTPDTLSSSGLNALHYSALFGHASAVSMLMARTSGSLNVPDPGRGWNALHMAASLGNHEVVAAMIECDGGSVNQLTRSGYTALHLASMSGHEQVVVTLLDAPGIEPDIQNENGQTALHMAVSFKKGNVVAALVRAPRVDVNAVQKEGFCALHLAVQFGDFEILKQLLEVSRIDVNLATPSGNTALAMCAGLGRNPVGVDAALKLLAHPDIDPNGAVFLINSVPVMDYLRHKAQAPSTLSDEDFAVQELERWTCFRPTNGVPNWLLSSVANNVLSQRLHRQQGYQPSSTVARRDNHIKDAAFRQTLALEQSLQFYGGYNSTSRFFAQQLLVMVPREPAGVDGELLPDDHYHNQFVLDGIAYSRGEIEDMALGRGRYALETEVDNIAHAQWGANVHQEGFLLRGRDILERLAQAGGVAELTMEDTVAIVEEAITNLTPFPVAHVLMERILARLDPSQSQPMPQDVKQRMDDFLSVLLEPEHTLVRDCWRSRMMRLGLAQVQSQDGEVNEGGLVTSAPRTLHLMQSYIAHQSTLPDRQAVAQQLQYAVLERLYDIGREPQVCNTGCVQRLLDAAAGVDDNLMAREPHDRAIFDEILNIGSVVNRAFDVHCKEGDQAIVTDDDQRNYDELSGAVRKDILRATTIDDLIRRRGWSRTKVEAQLNAVLDGL